MSSAKSVGKRIVILLNAAVLAAGLAWGQTGAGATGGISGTVAGPNGNGLPATVRVARWGSPKQTAQAKSGSDGTFSLTGLAAGLYSICATASGPGFADGCLWGHQAPARVKIGTVTSGQTLALETSATLQIQINDPGAVLSQAIASSAVPGTVKTHLMVGVLTDNKLFVSAPVSSSTSTVRNHAVTVPANRSVSILLISHGLTVASPAAPGTNVSGAGIPVTTSSTQANAPVVFTVKGGSN